MFDTPGAILGAIFAAIAVFGLFIGFAKRYKRCPSDKVLVIYGKWIGSAREGASARCLHGGAAFILPILQDYQYLDLTPIPIEINLQGALSQQNIRVNTPSTFTVGISTEIGVMHNAAERLLGLMPKEIQELARDIIFGQMRVVIATMPIEEINTDRDKLIDYISNGVEVELKKVGLRLINVNIQDITDESGYIDALGKEAAARAINDAKIKVAEQTREGEIGKANAERDQRINVASAQATAVEGENTAKITIAKSDATRREAEAEADRSATAAEKVKTAQALQESYTAEQAAEQERANREQATQYADIVIPAEIEKQRVITLADAEAENIRRVKQGEADGLKLMLVAEAEGVRAILTQKAEGFGDLVSSAGNNPEHASMLMITEKLPELVAEQVKAITGIKIDKVTVWDNGSGSNASGKTGTADFLSGLVGSLPPLHEVAKNAGLKLPGYLGTEKTTSKPEDTETTTE